MAEYMCPVHGTVGTDGKKWPRFLVAGLKFGACGHVTTGRSVDVPFPETGDRMPGSFYIVRDKCGYPIFCENGDEENPLDKKGLIEYIKKHKIKSAIGSKLLAGVSDEDDDD